MAVLDELLVRLGVDMSDAEQQVDEGAQGIENRLNGLSVAGGVAAAGLGAAFVVGLGAAMDISSVTTQLENQLNLTDEEAARAGSVAGDVFAAGFGGSMDEVGEALSAVSSSMQEFGTVSDKEMEQLTKSALGLAKTFNFDVNEAAAGAGNLIKAGLAKDGTEAMDLLAAAAQKLPSAMREELPAVTKEYSEFFGQLGFTGPQMMGLLTEAAKNPTFEIDKMGDAIKEFTLLMADTGKVTDPLKELGLDVEHIQKLMNTGQGTKAFDEVNNALLKVEDQTKRTALQAALFGGPGEDVGNTLQAIAEAGGTAGTSLGDVAGAAKKVTDKMEASPAQQFDSIMRSVTMTLGEMLLPALKFVANLFAEHPGLVKVLVPIVLALAAALVIAAAAQWAMNAALLANPYTWIVIAIVALAAIIIANWDKIKEWTIKIWDAVWGFIKGAAAKIWDIFLNWTILGLVIKHWDTIKSKTIAAWNAIVAWVKGIPGMLYNAFLNFTLIGLLIKHWDTIKRSVSDRANGLIDLVRRLPGRMADAARGMWGFVTSGLKGAVNGAIGIVNDAIFFINDKLIANANRIPGVSIPWIPYIPFLAEGGITTGPTLAMIGEGAEDEVVLPLSRLEGMLNTASAPSVHKVAPAEQRMVLELRGGSRAFREFFQESVRAEAGSDIEVYVRG
jgi:hypothetical protein